MKIHQIGYSIIELLVVITIMGLLVGGGIAGFNTMNRRQGVLSAGRELLSVMRSAQGKASSGIKPTVCAQLVGYSVSGSINTNTYTLSAVCTDKTTVIKSYQMGGGTQLLATFNTLFSVQTGGAGGSIGDLSLKSSSYTYTLNISDAGDVSEKGLQ